jgi:hypothetical protein
MQESMEIYPRTAVERAMKLQEVLLRASAGKIKWWQAAELIGISDRQMRRRRKRFEEQGYEGFEKILTRFLEPRGQCDEARDCLPMEEPSVPHPGKRGCSKGLD